MKNSLFLSCREYPERVGSGIDEQAQNNRCNNAIDYTGDDVHLYDFPFLADCACSRTGRHHIIDANHIAGGCTYILQGENYHGAHIHEESRLELQA